MLDDGWFGERKNDSTSLGDRTANLKKLPEGIVGLSAKIHTLGTDIGDFTSQLYVF